VRLERQCREAPDSTLAHGSVGLDLVDPPIVGRAGIKNHNLYVKLGLARKIGIVDRLVGAQVYFVGKGLPALKRPSDTAAGDR
jgi:hypothetical protein